MIAKKTRSYYFLLVGILALLTAGSFMAYTVYGAITKNRTSAEQKEAIVPLTGTLNDKAINNINIRRQFSPTDLENIQSLDYSFKADKTNKGDSSIVETSPVTKKSVNTAPVASFSAQQNSNTAGETE